ncbi:hypothetical protein MNBD_GAMMA12-1992 [hydrothermal vent metagenome]|uniref:Uncharacterized protein n=1 Tax=hydrothermal vent metagenome TaxID=652676 RepID=A0A3B0ZKJ5_9ZZZZ
MLEIENQRELGIVTTFALLLLKNFDFTRIGISFYTLHTFILRFVSVYYLLKSQHGYRIVEMNYEAVINQLCLAFPSHKIDSERAFTSWGATYLDAKEFKLHLDGKSWNELDVNYLEVREDSLGFLGTKHFTQVLPAYLQAIVEGISPLSTLADTLLMILTKPSSETDSHLGEKRFEELVNELTDEQLVAIAMSLVYFTENHKEEASVESATLALDKFWRQYL